LTVEEAALAFQDIITQAPYNLKTCANPDGGKIIRVAPNGHVQQLSDANTWEDPTGDYAIPPTPAREGSDSAIICLASKNAANVLQLLYENVTDSFNSGLDEAEAETALTLTLVSLVGAEFAPITFALVTFFGVAFGVLYGLLEFIGADLWDDTFTDTLTCILQGCASAVDGVVSFDYDCFNDALAAQTNVFDLTFEQLRLFGQIQYLLLVTGGVDMLNLSGATTAITDDNCDFCEPRWCYDVDLTLDPWLLTVHTQAGWSAAFGHWVAGVGFVSDVISHSSGAVATLLEVELNPPPNANYTITFAYVYWESGANPQPAYLGFDGDYTFSGILPDGDNLLEDDTDVTNPTLFDLQLNPAFGSAPGGGLAILSRITMQGRGENPFGETNC